MRSNKKRPRFTSTTCACHLEATHLDAFVAIEPVSRTFYLGATLSEAGRNARRAFPDRTLFATHVAEAITMRPVAISIAITDHVACATAGSMQSANNAEIIRFILGI